MCRPLSRPQHRGVLQRGLRPPHVCQARFPLPQPILGSGDDAFVASMSRCRGCETRSRAGEDGREDQVRLRPGMLQAPGNSALQLFELGTSRACSLRAACASVRVWLSASTSACFNKLFAYDISNFITKYVCLYCGQCTFFNSFIFACRCVRVSRSILDFMGFLSSVDKKSVCSATAYGTNRTTD